MSNDPVTFYFSSPEELECLSKDPRRLLTIEFFDAGNLKSSFSS
jgi:hypothetical protein